MISCPSESAIFPWIYVVRKMLLPVITHHKPSLPVNWARLLSSVFLPSTNSLSVTTSVHLSSELQHWLAFWFASSPSLISKLSHSWNQDRLLWGNLFDQSNSDCSLLQLTTEDTMQKPNLIPFSPPTNSPKQQISTQVVSPAPFASILCAFLS